MVCGGTDLARSCAVICLTGSVLKAITIPLMEARPESSEGSFMA